MAGDKSKKRAEKNTARLKLLFRTVAGSVLFHVLLRLVWKGSTASAWIHYPLFATAATSGILERRHCRMFAISERVCCCRDELLVLLLEPEPPWRSHVRPGG